MKGEGEGKGERGGNEEVEGRREASKGSKKEIGERYTGLQILLKKMRGDLEAFVCIYHCTPKMPLPRKQINVQSK
jgi:hypothetical protein